MQSDAYQADRATARPDQMPSMPVPCAPQVDTETAPYGPWGQQEDGGGGEGGTRWQEGGGVDQGRGDARVEENQAQAGLGVGGGGDEILHGAEQKGRQGSETMFRPGMCSSGQAETWDAPESVTRGSRADSCGGGGGHGSGGDHVVFPIGQQAAFGTQRDAYLPDEPNRSLFEHHAEHPSPPWVLQRQSGLDGNVRDPEAMRAQMEVAAEEEMRNHLHRGGQVGGRMVKEAGEPERGDRMTKRAREGPTTVGASLGGSYVTSDLLCASVWRERFNLDEKLPIDPFYCLPH